MDARTPPGAEVRQWAVGAWRVGHMDFRDPDRRGGLIAGAALVLIGIGVLIVQLSGVEVGWPAWIVVPGLAIFVVALAVGGPGGVGLAILGGILTSIGLVLAVQDATGAWASWAYAWALVAPGGVGAGMLLYGLLTTQWDVARGGLGTLVAGIAIFLVGYLFFEGVLGLDGRPSGDFAKVVVPAALIGLGLLVIVAAFTPRQWRGSAATSGAGWAPAGGSWSGGGSWGRGPTGTAGPAEGPVAPGAGSSPGSAAPGDAGASAAAGFGAAASSAAGSAFASGAGDAGASAAAAGDPDARAVDLGGASAGEVVLGFGAGHLAIGGAAAPGHLVDGVFRGGVKREDRGAGSVRLTTPGEAFWGRVWTGTPPFEWRVGLTAEVPLRLGLEVGAARTDADLTGLRVTDLRVKCGAAETDVLLPAAAGQTRVEIEAGAASVRVRVPAGVAARIRSSVALGSTDVDTARFPRDPLGGWASPDFATATNRADIEVRGGVGAVAIR